MVDLPSHFLLWPLWLKITKGKECFRQWRWFTTEVIRRGIILEVFKIDRDQVIFSSLWRYWSPSDSIYALCVVSSHFSDKIVKICRNFVNSVKWKTKWKSFRCNIRLSHQFKTHQKTVRKERYHFVVASAMIVGSLLIVHFTQFEPQFRIFFLLASCNASKLFFFWRKTVNQSLTKS